MRNRLLWCGALFCAQAFADLTIDFSNRNLLDPSSTAIWNFGLSKLHLPFVIDRDHSSTCNTEDESLSIGSGSDGAFGPESFSLFDINGGSIPNTITLNSSRIYEFTTFDLPFGYTLFGSGSEGLEIEVQGDVAISGTIDLRGENGTAANASLAVTPSGGEGGCGGGAGGDGGSTANSVADDGTGADSGNTGRGRHGLETGSGNAGSRSGGGGGGGFEGAPFAATAGLTDGAGGSGGAAGAEYSDDFLEPLIGGSGGGGGARYTLGGSNGSGGGGGGGGGALSIKAGGDITVSASGQILANGGDGGPQAAGVLSGGGGGGSGGALLLIAGGVVTNNGTIEATAGAGTGGGNGDGASGRTRVLNFSGHYPYEGSNNVDPAPMPATASVGETCYTQTSSYILTKTIDLQNTAPMFLNLEATDTSPSNTSINYQVAGSSDNFQADSTGFIDSSLISNLNGKRYIKIKATLVTTDRRVTPSITGLTLRYQNHVQNMFRFGAEMSCAGVVHRTGSAVPNIFLLIFLFFIPRIPIPRRFRKVD